MIKQDHIKELVEQHLTGTDLFMVKTTVGKDNLISVYIDGDHGVTIDECVGLRHEP